MSRSIRMPVVVGLAWLGLALLQMLRGANCAEPARSTDVVSGAWVEDLDGKPTLVVGLYRRVPVVEQAVGSVAGSTKVFVGVAVAGAREEPGGYGVIPTGGWTEVVLEPGVLVRVQRALRGSEIEDPPAVLVLPTAAQESLEVHRMIDGDVPADALLFARPTRRLQMSVAKHVVEIGEAVEVVVAAPEASLFLPETLEIARVARRLGLDAGQPEGDSGYVSFAWLPPEGEPPAARELRGAAGEQRIRSHFTDPKCLWAERHVGWMDALWILEYAKATPLRFRMETDTVRRPGRVYDIWKGYGAVSIDAIYPNGFGGSSSNHDLPVLLVVPKGTKTRTVALP